MNTGGGYDRLLRQSFLDGCLRHGLSRNRPPLEWKTQEDARGQDGEVVRGRRGKLFGLKVEQDKTSIDEARGLLA